MAIPNAGSHLSHLKAKFSQADCKTLETLVSISQVFQDFPGLMIQNFTTYLDRYAKMLNIYPQLRLCESIFFIYPFPFVQGADDQTKAAIFGALEKLHVNSKPNQLLESYKYAGFHGIGLDTTIYNKIRFITRDNKTHFVDVACGSAKATKSSGFVETE